MYLFGDTMADVSIETVSQKELASLVADELVASIQEVLSLKDRCSLVVSGGRTPGAAYCMLSRPPLDQEIEWDRIDLFWGDERFVPHDDDQSNYHLVHQTLLSNLKNDQPRVYPVDTSYSTAEEAAQAYEKVIQEAGYHVDAIGSPPFDIVMLGMGEDGHTASLFPGDPALDEVERVVVATKEPHQQMSRVTMSPRALFSSPRVYFVLFGENKASVLKRVLESDEQYSTLPARLYTQAAGRVFWFVDQSAAKELSPSEE